MLRKIHTDQRPSLSQETLISLMTVKFNCLECCCESALSEELLKECKRGTSKKLLIFMMSHDIIFYYVIWVWPVGVAKVPKAVLKKLAPMIKCPNHF